jgi:hypothetical protein
MKLKANILIENRYDIVIKYLYARSIEDNINTDLFREIYSEHLRVWNNFFESQPRKNSFDDYNDAFLKMLNDIKLDNFDWSKSPIPINNYNYPLNGAHRIAACLLYDKDVNCKIIKKNCEIWNRDFFIKRGLKKEYIKIIDDEITKNNIPYGNR